MTEERVQEIIATGQTESYLQQLVIYGQQSNELKEAFSKAQQQRSALLELEDSINQVQAMFHEFSLMVQDQGQLIDNIEANVEDAVDNVQQGSYIFYFSAIILYVFGMNTYILNFLNKICR